MESETQTVQGIPDHDLVSMLANALLEDWPADTRLAHVLAGVGYDIQSDVTIRELATAA